MLSCTKMNGNGNDFIMIDNRTRSYGAEELARFARLLCRRGLSVGADGLLVVEPSERADFRMRSSTATALRARCAATARAA